MHPSRVSSVSESRRARHGVTERCEARATGGVLPRCSPYGERRVHADLR